MNISHPGAPRQPSPDRHDPNFDAQLRQLHGVALSTLAPSTLARLRAARHEASAGAHARAGRHRGVWWVTACSAVLAIGLGLQLERSTPGTGTATVAAVAATADGDDVLEQNPDLYVWLVSDNALAME